jgi:hypothetical protein
VQEREKVKELVAKKAPVADIAKLLGRSIPNLRKYFSKEIFSEKKSKPGAALPFKITEVHRQKVIRYIGCKMKAVDVARALNISEGQLLEHFAEQVASGHALARAAVIDHLHDQMEDGVVGATNRLEALTASSEPGESAAQSPGYVGKKVAANSAAAAAASAGGRFAPPAAPKLVVDNSA